ncbi:hypothetical protein BD31_I0992 [Candidatus Nitrosopumilus salaria BD31]|uniref:Uncharacterized protein n=2 Tax=Nitrosopumilus TaxID=338191 RepID=I3D0S7_9ARCH|nr:hypothetical protein BD31_I0992 [Candidatus Nitrosopumilus salaria BD31]
MLDMTFCCKGVCDTFHEKPLSNIARYEAGQKRCTLCSMFFETTNLRCPCCGARLRTKSRNKKHSWN